MLRPCVAYGGGPSRENGRATQGLRRAHCNPRSIIDEADEMVSPDWVDDMKEVIGGGIYNDCFQITTATTIMFT